MENDWIAKWAYVGEFAGSRSVGRPEEVNLYREGVHIRKEFLMSRKQGE